MRQEGREEVEKERAAQWEGKKKKAVLENARLATANKIQDTGGSVLLPRNDPVSASLVDQPAVEGTCSPIRRRFGICVRDYYRASCTAYYSLQVSLYKVVWAKVN